MTQRTPTSPLLTRVCKDHVGTQEDARRVPWLAPRWGSGKKAAQQWRTAARSNAFGGNTCLEACQQSLQGSDQATLHCIYHLTVWIEGEHAAAMHSNEKPGAPGRPSGCWATKWWQPAARSWFLPAQAPRRQTQWTAEAAWSVVQVLLALAAMCPQNGGWGCLPGWGLACGWGWCGASGGWRWAQRQAGRRAWIQERGRAP